MEPADHAFIAQGRFDRLREMQLLLARTDIQAEIVKPPGANANA